LYGPLLHRQSFFAGFAREQIQVSSPITGAFYRVRIGSIDGAKTRRYSPRTGFQPAFCPIFLTLASGFFHE
jgi:hypothetical protein